MTEFTYGPVELHLVGIQGDRPDPGVVQALGDLLEGGLLRLLDFVIITKSATGEISVVEVDDEGEGFGGLEPAATGVVGDEDIEEFAEYVEPGSSAALVAFELVYARTLAEKLDTSGAAVLHSERIPAPIVNHALGLAE